MFPATIIHLSALFISFSSVIHASSLLPIAVKQDSSLLARQVVKRDQPDQPDIGTTVGTYLSAYEKTVNCTGSEYTFKNPQYGICYTLLSGTTPVDTYSVVTDATYPCEVGTTPTVLYYTSSTNCVFTFADIDKGYISPGSCQSRSGVQSIKSFMLSCTSNAI